MRKIWEAITGMTGWKGRLLLFAGVCVLIGIFLNLGSYIGEPEETIMQQSGSAPSLRADWNSGPSRQVELEARAQTWGDAAIRFGGSFMVAMIIGSLLRAFVKTMAIALVGAVVVLWVLNDRGIIEPFWEDAFESWEQGKQWIMAQTDSTVSLLKGYVPSMTSAVLGLGFGLRR